MAVTWVLKPEDVARIRFAFSPLWELVASLRTLQDPARQALHLPWLTCVRPRLAGLDLDELLALVPPTASSGRASTRCSNATCCAVRGSSPAAARASCSPRSTRP
ncbi:hypothetical protein OUY22_06400 [Nonomuraea sp. MCN248]|uniref:Transcriptional regulator n=1 Tax=Nonomuraea corallina TaxID=2989783 RepID=A0ABT4S7X2_9ACTN|nr:hypothetical protein [Nonomuraea corallina]MDA0633045.1 hypothetical protein [Nonomuraea corallina]